ncbi:MAG: hypothetical protein QG602_1510, partial [Verrucomicrobiota bacterium]|nr:hypothetical protein [Verrucomicrobiota bacterium]
APEAAQWGDAPRIWPEGNRWLPPPSREQALASLRANLPWAAMTSGQRDKWEEFLAELAAWAPGAEWGGAMVLILKNSLAVWPEIRHGSAEVMVMRKRLSLDEAACAALDRVIATVAGGELARRLETTRGIHAVLRGYEQNYHALVRRAGRLTFADVQRLLSPEAGAPALSCETGANRIFIDYRLDAEIDHWLLDEFQDTSFGQWGVLRNLIDEVVQDPAGVRSFFCVGDVKQAIYTWREGDPRLFGEIWRHYTAAAPGAIVMGHLDESWRSGPPVLAMVNGLFGRAEALTELFPGPLSASWNAVWREHVPALRDRTGQAAWLLAEDEAARHETVWRVLRELRPLERGLSCAVLVQTNREAAELAEYLRQAGGLPAVAESDLRVCTDNPLGAALLALVQAAAHPGDTLAWEHVCMTPFATVLARESVATPEELTRRLLSQVQGEGFERMVSYWLGAVEPLLASDDTFSRDRSRQLVDAARLFDATGSRDAAEFLAFMERHTVREPEGATGVRVMTIHKSKGLGFEVVFLPDLEGTKLDQARDGLAVHKAPDRSVEWVLDPPPRLIADNDPVLAAHALEAAAEAGYEALSLLYVALTRAKRGLYVITEPPGNSTSRNYPRLLAATLGGGVEKAREVMVGSLRLVGAWCEGDARWHEGVEAGPSASEPEVPLRILGGKPAMRRYHALRPSVREEAWTPVLPSFFSLRGGEAAEFGTAVHRLLAQVEWGPATETATTWKISTEPQDAVAEARAVLQAPELDEVWTRSDGDTLSEVWRERAFEMIWDEAWVTGTMDRVVLECSKDGRALRARIYDFKTDWVGADETAEAAIRHTGQMRLYRQAVARLTGLSLDRVDASLVFTRLRRLEPAGR